MNIIGTRIRNAREKKSLTQAAFATLMGVTVQTVWRWENDARIPDVPTLQRIARVLETTTAYLIGDPDQLSKPSSDPIYTLFQTIPEDDYLDEMIREREERIKRVQDSNREKTQESTDKAEENVPCPGAVKEAAASAVLHDKNQPDELISLLVEVRKQMIAEYPQMDVNDKNIVKKLLAKINTLTNDIEETKDTRNGIA